ncbi:MAG: peptidase MA family metallohydrolase [Myxococcota bacterium]|nr:peptidase MA family metallohydrolase [Myxococcota bacterium]
MHWLFLFLNLFLLPQEASAAEWATTPEVEVHVAGPPDLPEDWTSTSGIYARVHSSRSALRAQVRLSKHAETAIPEIASFLGVAAASRIEVMLTDTPERFRTLQPSAPPAWADATAWPSRSWIFLRTNEIRGGTAKNETQVFDHEITHVLLGQAFGPRRVPHWLQEGLSQWTAKEYTPETTRQIASGLLGKGLHTLEDLHRGFPADPVSARLAYAQSADFIAWIVAEYGEDSVRKLINGLSGGLSLERAVKESTGERLRTIDQAWRSRLEDSWLWLQPLTVDQVWMLVGAIALVIGFFGVRRRNRRRLELWQQEEELQDAMYTLLMTEEDEETDSAVNQWVH